MKDVYSIYPMEMYEDLFLDNNEQKLNVKEKEEIVFKRIQKNWVIND